MGVGGLYPETLERHLHHRLKIFVKDIALGKQGRRKAGNKHHCIFQRIGLPGHMKHIGIDEYTVALMQLYTGFSHIKIQASLCDCPDLQCAVPVAIQRVVRKCTVVVRAYIQREGNILIINQFS